jgi:hypothetical protein
VARLDSGTASSTSRANATVLKPAHSFRNRLLREAGRKLCKRDHFPGKDSIVGMMITRLSMLTNIPAAQPISQGSTASADQVEDQDDQRDHQQKVNQAAGYVETETQKPQNQNDNQNCPKHIFSIASGTAASLKLQAG